MSIVVERQRLTPEWRERAEALLATGDKERHFNAPARLWETARALFAFDGSDKDPAHAIGILVYAVRQVDRRRILHIDFVFVLKEQRGFGVGLKLLAAAYDEAVERSCLDVQLDVRPFNYPMLRVLEKAGYSADEPRQLRKSVDESRRPEGEFF